MSLLNRNFSVTRRQQFKIPIDVTLFMLMQLVVIFIHQRKYIFGNPFWWKTGFYHGQNFRKFDGDPLKFRTFMNNFECHVETKVESSKLRPCYLIQHSKPKIQSKIQHFFNYGKEGYFLTKSKLPKEYGRPCVISVTFVRNNLKMLLRLNRTIPKR